MRLLADENIDRPIVEWLRSEGHDVLEMSAAAPGSSDVELIRLSREQDRILVTFDRDIGRLILSERAPHPGIVYLRLRASGPELWEEFRRLWPAVAPTAAGHFCTVRRDRIRRRPLRGPDG